MARFLMLILLVSSGPLLAMTDPLRPPPGFGGGSAAMNETDPDAVLVLQSVLLAPGRQIALISGRSVAVGGRIGDYRLISLNARTAVLQGPQGRMQLQLIPSYKPAAPARAAQAAQPVPGGRPE